MNKTNSLIEVAARNIVRTFILLLIPYFIISQLSYPIEFFPRPFYIIGFLVLISLFNINSSVALNKVRIKFETIKIFLSVRNNAVLTFSLVIIYSIEAFNQRAFIPGGMLSILSLIAAYIPLKDDQERQLITLAYFFSITFFFLSFV